MKIDIERWKRFKKLKQLDRIEFFLESQRVEEKRPTRTFTFGTFVSVLLSLATIDILMFILAMQFDGLTRLNLLITTMNILKVINIFAVLYFSLFILEFIPFLYFYNKWRKFKKVVLSSYLDKISK